MTFFPDGLDSQLIKFQVQLVQLVFKAFQVLQVLSVYRVHLVHKVPLAQKVM
jgi:hypothetical protein